MIPNARPPCAPGLFYHERRAKDIHSVIAKQSMHFFDLRGGISLAGHFRARRQALELTDGPEEFLHIAGGLVDVDDLPRLVSHRGPPVSYVARNKNALTRAHTKRLRGDLKLKFTGDDVNPFI